MTTIINEATRLRLEWLEDQLAKLYDNSWVRLDGETVFRTARQELADIIASAVEPLSATPVVTLAAMPLQQVEALVDAAVARVEAGKADTAATVVAALRVEMEGSDLEVLDAIAQTRADVLAAIPAAAPATA